MVILNITNNNRNYEYIVIYNPNNSRWERWRYYNNGDSTTYDDYYSSADSFGSDYLRLPMSKASGFQNVLIIRCQYRVSAKRFARLTKQ